MATAITPDASLPRLPV